MTVALTLALFLFTELFAGLITPQDVTKNPGVIITLGNQIKSIQKLTLPIPKATPTPVTPTKRPTPTPDLGGEDLIVTLAPTPVPTPEVIEPVTITPEPTLEVTLEPTLFPTPFVPLVVTPAPIISPPQIIVPTPIPIPSPTPDVSLCGQLASEVNAANTYYTSGKVGEGNPVEIALNGQTSASTAYTGEKYCLKPVTYTINGVTYQYKYYLQATKFCLRVIGPTSNENCCSIPFSTYVIDPTNYVSKCASSSYVAPTPTGPTPTPGPTPALTPTPLPSVAPAATPYPAYCSVVPSSPVIPRGGSKQFSVICSDSRNAQIPCRSMSWSIAGIPGTFTQYLTAEGMVPVNAFTHVPSNNAVGGYVTVTEVPSRLTCTTSISIDQATLPSPTPTPSPTPSPTPVPWARTRSYQVTPSTVYVSPGGSTVFTLYCYDGVFDQYSNPTGVSVPCPAVTWSLNNIQGLVSPSYSPYTGASHVSSVLTVDQYIVSKMYVNGLTATFSTPLNTFFGYSTIVVN